MHGMKFDLNPLIESRLWVLRFDNDIFNITAHTIAGSNVNSFQLYGAEIPLQAYTCSLMKTQKYSRFLDTNTNETLKVVF